MPVNGNERSKTIIRYNLIGVGMNFILALLKITVGFHIRSGAVILDGINGCADMMSSGISIAASTVAGRRADKAHPLGYGRLEYVSSLFITMLIMYMGIRSIIGSVAAIIQPLPDPKYNTVIIVVMIVSVFCKISYGVLLRRVGRRLNSVSLIMTGTESLGDALVSTAILAAIVSLRFFRFNLEPYLCILISIMILYTGIKMIRECMNKILGQRIDQEYKKEIKQALIMEDGVLNVCNLMVHTYGEDVLIGSVDIEVEGDMKAAEATKLSRRLIRRAAEHGLTLTSVGITGSSLSDPRADEIWDTILDVARKHEDILQVQRFTVDFEEKVISFFVILDYGNRNRSATLEAFRAELEPLFPDMTIELTPGIDI